MTDERQEAGKREGAELHDQDSKCPVRWATGEGTLVGTANQFQ